MSLFVKNLFKNVDWILYLSVLFICLAGLFTMNSFSGQSTFFDRQIIWIIVSTVIFFSASLVDWSFLKNTRVIVSLFTFSSILLFLLFIAGKVTKGAQSWFDFGAFSFQPVDPVKIVIVLLLAKYFSRRHIEIANIRHILVSGAYVFTIFLLINFFYI